MMQEMREVVSRELKILDHTTTISLLHLLCVLLLGTKLIQVSMIILKLPQWLLQAVTKTFLITVEETDSFGKQKLLKQRRVCFSMPLYWEMLLVWL